MAEAAFDVLHRFRKIVRGDEQMDVVRHDHEGVKFIGAGAAIVLKRVEEEARGGVDLEATKAHESDGCDEEGAGGGGSLRPGHARNCKWALCVGERGRVQSPSLSRVSGLGV